jgi:hypothetical protein
MLVARMQHCCKSVVIQRVAGSKTLCYIGQVASGAVLFARAWPVVFGVVRNDVGG